MGGIGHNHFRTLRVTAQYVILTHHHQTGKLAVCSCIRIEREFGKTRDIGKRALQIVVKFECSLRRILTLQRMQRGKFRHSSHLLVDLRIVFHCATAQWIESGVYTEVFV